MGFHSFKALEENGREKEERDWSQLDLFLMFELDYSDCASAVMYGQLVSFERGRGEF